MSSGPSQAIRWLSGSVDVCRGFIERIKEEGLDAVLKDCPHDDLTDLERATFEACFDDPDLRGHKEAWWPLYDGKREAGVVPRAAEADQPWWPLDAQA